MRRFLKIKNQGDKKMKNRFYKAIAALTIFLTGFSFAHAQTGTDLGMRTALYFTGAKTDKIDLSKDKYVAAGATMELKKSEATSCEGNTCTFNIGFIAFRNGQTSGELSTFGLLQIEKGGFVGNTVYFAAEEKTKQGILPLKLKTGMNRVTFTIDPYEKTPESNEDNNSFSVNFRVTAGPQPAPRK
jgi:hypothetical protein